MTKIHLYDKILTPLITEKSTNLSEQNKIVFKVPRSANKKNLKNNIEKIFKVNVTKINMLGGHYGSHFSALTSDGILYCWGATNQGSDGAGLGSNYNNATTPTGLSPVKIPEKIIDYDVGGYSSSGTGYFTVLALTESNTLYAFGYNNYYASNDFNGARWTPKRVQF